MEITTWEQLESTLSYIGLGVLLGLPDLSDSCVGNLLWFRYR